MRARTGRNGRLGPVLRAGLAGLVVVALAGCDILGDRTGQLADEVTSRGASELDQAVRDRVDAALERFGGSVDVQRVCELVADDRLTEAEREPLEAAIAVGDELGLPAAVIEAGRRVLDATDGATDRVAALVDACGDVPSPSPGT